MKDYEINRTILTSLIKSFTLIFDGSKISVFYVSFQAIPWNENFREFCFLRTTLVETYFEYSLS